MKRMKRPIGSLPIGYNPTRSLTLILALILFAFIGNVFAQGVPHLLHGTISNHEHLPPDIECFKLTLIYEVHGHDTTVVVDFDAAGNGYDDTYSDTSAAWAVMLEDIALGTVVELFFEDTCIHEFHRLFHTVTSAVATDIGHVHLDGYVHGLRPSLGGILIDPGTGYIDDTYEFGVTYTSPMGRAPVLLEVIVDDILTFDIETVFDGGLDYYSPQLFTEEFDGVEFGKGVHEFYFYAEDILGFPGVTDTFSFEILNTPPDVPELSFTPVLPFDDEDITCNILNPDADLDGDDLSYEFVWMVDDELVLEGMGEDVLGNAFFNAGNVVVVNVRAFDGEEYSDYNDFTVTVTGPQLLDVAVDPDSAIRTQEFTYTATYRNLRDVAPENVTIAIDSEEPVEMTAVDPEDDDYVAGVDYTYTTTLSEVGLHEFTVYAEDELGHEVEVTLDGPYVINQAPTAPTVEVVSSDDPPAVTSEITCNADESEDPDGDEVDYVYTWYVNDEAVAEETNTLSEEYFGRGDEIYCDVYATDGLELGNSEVVSSNVIEISNAVPLPPIVHIDPEHPFEMEDIYVVFDTEGSDPDGDDVDYVYAWRMDDETHSTDSYLDHEYTQENEEWTLQVFSFDGIDFSEPFEFDFSIDFPVFNAGSVTPDSGTSGETFTFECTFASNREHEVDEAFLVLDGEDMYSLTEGEESTWFADVEVIGRGMHEYTFTGTDIAGNTIVSIAGIYEGPMIYNTAPVIVDAWVGSDPEGDYSRNADLLAMVDLNDPDEDVIEYTYIWYVNDIVVPVIGDVLTNDWFERYDEVYFMVIANDGIVETDTAVSDVITVQNAAPFATDFNLTPAFPITLDDIETNIDVIDLDDDEFDVTYTWMVDSVLTDWTRAILPAHLTAKNETWIAIAAIEDGQDTSYSFAEVTIQNTAPHLYLDIEDTIAFVDVEFEAVLPVRDNDIDLLTFELIEGPEEMELTSNSGRLTWMPESVGVYPVEVTVTDDEDDITLNFNIVVYANDDSILNPTDLEAESGYAGIVPLRWNAPALFDMVTVLPLEFTGYEIDRKLTTDADWTTIATTARTRFNDESVTDGVVYMYRVRATFGEVISEYTEPAYATPGSDDALMWYSAYSTEATPIIDGEMDETAWNDATIYSFGETIVRVKNNDSRLYIAVYDYADPTLDINDRVVVSIDDNYNGRFPLVSVSDEGEYRLENTDEGIRASFQGIFGVFPEDISRDPRGESEHVIGAASELGEGVYYEMAIDFTPDTEVPAIIETEVGNVIGFRLEVFDAGRTAWDFVFPADTDAEDAESFGGLMIGEGYPDGDIYVRPTTREIFLRQGTWGTLPLYIGNEGTGIITYTLNESYLPYSYEDAIGREMEEDIIVLSDGYSVAEDALDIIGFTYTVYSDPSEFVAAMEDYTLAVISWHGNLSDDVFDALELFRQEGGKLVISYADFDMLSSESEFWYGMGISLYEDLGERSSALNFDAPDHPIFNIPEEIPFSIDRLDGEFEDFGDALQIYSTESAAIFPASFDRFPYPINASIAVTTDSKAIVNSFAIAAMDDWDGDDTPDGVELMANEILYVANSEDIDWLSVEPDFGALVSREEDCATVRFDAREMTVGTYNGYIHVNSNDPDEPFIPVHCIMHVGNAEGLRLWFETELVTTNAGLEFEIPVFVNNLSGMNMTELEFTIYTMRDDFLMPLNFVPEFSDDYTVLAMNGDSIKIAINSDEPFEGGGLLGTIRYRVAFDAEVGEVTYIEMGEPGYDEEAFVEFTDYEDNLMVRILGTETDWMVDLLFRSYDERDNIVIGAHIDATSEFDAAFDELHEVSGSWFDVWSDITDIDPTNPELDNDIRNAMDDEIIWYIETGDSAGKVEWEFRDEDTLMAMGSLYINDVINMKTETEYNYEAGEDIYIVYRTSGETPVNYRFQPGYSMFSLPVNPRGGFVDVDDFAADYLGCWRFDTETRNWRAVEELYPGVGYIILVDTESEHSVWGTPIGSLELDLLPGWNLIGTVYGITDFSRPDITPEGALIGMPEYANYYNTSTREYVRTNTLNSGQAYFVLSEEDASLDLPGSYGREVAPRELEKKSAFISVNGNVIELGSSSEDIFAPVPPAIPGANNELIGVEANGYISSKSLKADGDLSWTLVANSHEISIESIELPAGWNITVDGKELPVSFNRGGDYTVEITETSIPNEIEIVGNYPNPFNTSTKIEYVIPTDGKVKVSVHDVNGREVTTLIDEKANAGHGSILWDGTDDAGNTVTTGVYYVRVESAGNATVKSMLLVK